MTVIGRGRCFAFFTAVFKVCKGFQEFTDYDLAYTQAQFIEFIIQIMSTQYEVLLKVNNLKGVKTGLQSFSFYLTLHSGLELVEVTSSRDLLYDDTPFVLNPEISIDRIEVWNYHRQKKIGSLLIKKHLQEHFYTHDFKNAHLRVELKVQSHLDGSKRLDSSHSTHSALSEESL